MADNITTEKSDRMLICDRLRSGMAYKIFLPLELAGGKYNPDEGITVCEEETCPYGNSGSCAIPPKFADKTGYICNSQGLVKMLDFDKVLREKIKKFEVKGLKPEEQVFHL